jgi:actin-like protein 6A
MFEKHETAAFFLSKDAVLSCYAVGKSTGLVVDCGGSGTVVTPVSDGWVELKAVSRNSIGGRFMDAYMIQLVAKKLKSVPKPMYKLNKAIGQNNLTNSISFSSNNASSSQEDFSGLQPSFDGYMNLELGRDIREAVCEVANSSLAESEAKFVTLPTTPYELPDGTIIDLGIERFQLPELFLDTSPLLSLSGSSAVTSSSSPLTSSELASIGNTEINSVAAGNSVYPIMSDLEKLVGTYPADSVSLPFSTESVPKMVIDSILKSENDIQSNLLNNLILKGGNSCYDGLLDRIRVVVERRIYLHTTGGYRLKMVANSDSERAIGAWLGGSILGSLGSFHEIWISKKEYEEYGSFIVDRKCP